MNDLTEAANILDTSEFEVLQRAHLHWYGQTATSAELEAVFSVWLQRQQLPAWARHYVSVVIRDFEQELGRHRLDPGLFWFWLVTARRARRCAARLLA